MLAYLNIRAKNKNELLLCDDTYYNPIYMISKLATIICNDGNQNTGYFCRRLTLTQPNSLMEALGELIMVYIMIQIVVIQVYLSVKIHQTVQGYKKRIR